MRDRRLADVRLDRDDLVVAAVGAERPEIDPRVGRVGDAVRGGAFVRALRGWVIAPLAVAGLFTIAACDDDDSGGNQPTTEVSVVVPDTGGPVGSLEPGTNIQTPQNQIPGATDATGASGTTTGD